MVSYSRVEDRETETNKTTTNRGWSFKGDRDGRGWGQRTEREKGEEKEMKERRNKGRKRFPSSLELPSTWPRHRAFELPIGWLTGPLHSQVTSSEITVTSQFLCCFVGVSVIIVPTV